MTDLCCATCGRPESDTAHTSDSRLVGWIGSHLFVPAGDETPGGTGGLDLGAEVIEWTGPPIGEGEIQETAASASVVVQAALDRGRHDSQLLDGREFNEERWDEADAALAALATERATHATPSPDPGLAARVVTLRRTIAEALEFYAELTNWNDLQAARDKGSRARHALAAFWASTDAALLAEVERRGQPREKP